MKIFFSALILSGILVFSSNPKVHAQNDFLSKKETVIFVIDISASKANSHIKNDLLSLIGVEMVEYCEKPDIKQALLILSIDRNLYSDNKPVELFLKNAGVTFKPVSNNSLSSLQQFFCQ